MAKKATAHAADELSREDRLVLALARGLQYRDVARESGFSVRQVGRKVVEPGIQQKVAETRERLMADAIGIFQARAAEIVCDLFDLAKEGTVVDTVRLKACESFLDLAIRWHEHGELLGKVKRLQAMIEASS